MYIYIYKYIHLYISYICIYVYELLHKYTIYMNAYLYIHICTHQDADVYLHRHAVDRRQDGD